jgi:uncharacterized repeat protein (TIGR03803 family)
MPSTAPTITGTVPNQTTTFETPIDPFSGVTIGDANAGATDTLSITLSGPGSLSGTGLSGSDGSYTMTGTAATITTELHALSFTLVDGAPNTSVTTTFTLSDTSSAYGVDTYDSQLSTLATFTDANGAEPDAGLTADAAGDLFGTTSGGGLPYNVGTVFEIAQSTGALTTLATFNEANASGPRGSLTIDAAGNLFGTTSFGGIGGTVFEIPESTGALTTLASFTGANGLGPEGSLTLDAAGDLLGTTAEGGATGIGAVFEIAKSTGAITNLASFTGANGSSPYGGLISDAAGDLFGTTYFGGTDDDGTVFEIAKSTGALTTLASFTGANGADPEGSLTIDAAGDLFGTTVNGGSDGDGTVFEIAKSTGALTTLATFTGANGAGPKGGLTIDAAGDLFGTTNEGGTDNDGTVFEIAKPTGGLTTLATFTGTNGAGPLGNLTIDAGNLFGTTQTGGADNDGTVFELPGSSAYAVVSSTTSVIDTDPVTPDDFLGNGTSDVLLQNGGTVADWIMQNGQYETGNILSTAAAGWNVVGTGDFTGNGTSDVLLQNGGSVVDWVMKDGVYQSGNVLTTGAAGWNVVGTGDFTGNGTDDVLVQSGGTVVDWIMKDGAYQSGNVLTTGAAGWKVVGTGDFSGNGTDDVLLQNGGTVADWIMQNGQYETGNVLTTAAAGWTVVGTGDFTGNGTSDILLQNGGTVAEWVMKDGAYQSGSILTTNATGWKVVNGAG